MSAVDTQPPPASKGQARAQTHQAPPYEPGVTPKGHQHPASPRQTSQAERAVMHPEHHDPDWRYYHAAGVG
jgi:hypothetical protein